MDHLWAIVGAVGIIIGILAGIVQVLDYLQKRREKKTGVNEPDSTPSAPLKTQIFHNLPSRGEFLGRQREKEEVHAALRSRAYLVSIEGIGGIGKTSLAREVAYECLAASKENRSDGAIAQFAGIIWTSARDMPLTLDTILDTTARTLEYQGIAQQTLDEKKIAVIRLLQEKPYLLIADNFETVTDDAVRRFLLNELPEPSKALITTREQKLTQARAISIKGMPRSEALALIRSEGKRLGLASVGQAADARLENLFQATGGAPLAIKWAIGQIKRQGQSLDTVLAALHEAQGSIFEFIYARSWRLLSATAQQLLLVMTLFTTSASKAGMEAASDLHHYTIDDALGQLVEMSLVDATDELELAKRRYNLHPLTRAYAEAELKRLPEVEQTARLRLAAYMGTVSAENGGFWNHPGYALLDEELPNILGSVRWCFSTDQARLGMDTLGNALGFMVIRGYWNEILELGQQALDLAARIGDEWNVARWKSHIFSWVYRHRGNLELAEQYDNEALAVFERLGDQENAAYTRRSLGRIAQERGDFEHAEPLLRAALSYYQSIGSERDIVFITNSIATNAMMRGDLDTAQSLCESGLAAARRLNDPERVAQILGVLGGVAHRRGDLAQAQTRWSESLSLMREARRPDAVADSLFSLAQIEIEAGRADQARPMFAEALEIYQKLLIHSRIQEIETLLAAIG